MLTKSAYEKMKNVLCFFMLFGSFDSPVSVTMFIAFRVPLPLGGTKHQSREYEMRHQNNGYFKLFAKNLI